MLWPGAVVDSNGNPLDWPGWRLVGGQWVQRDEFDWVRPQVNVTFVVNPEQTVAVSYPPSSPQCNANPPATSGQLASTGAGALAGVAIVAGVLVASGVGLVLVRRRTA